MIDNYDSFTYNLVQILLRLEIEVEVVRNDVESVDAMLARGPSGIVVSPGPGRPENAGNCLELFDRRPQLPILGVCLGHQVLALSCGAKVTAARTLMHGKTSEITHNQAGIFSGLSDPFEATRYHSLAVSEESLPDELEALAWSDDETLMGMRHRDYPYWGVQFHPESVLTVQGPRLVENFARLCSELPAENL
ncbi:MAG: aminodeoxychorismate/anthranilate synthase component II [Thermoanaerobaculia bacterium]